MPSKRGHRLTVWIPEEDYWVFDALDALIADFEHRGLPMTRSAIVREILYGPLAKIFHEKKKTELHGETGPEHTG